jgi:hypothetical protein
MDAVRTRTKVAAQIAGLGLVLAMYAGVIIALTGRRSGIFLVLGAVGVQMALHLVVGVVGYRQVMNRPWPSVPPLDDDDEDW